MQVLREILRISLMRSLRKKMPHAHAPITKRACQRPHFATESEKTRPHLGQISGRGGFYRAVAGYFTWSEEEPAVGIEPTAY